MKISKTKLEIALARAMKNTSDLKMPQCTLAKILNGYDVRPKTAGKIAQALGVDITEIMDDE